MYSVVGCTSCAKVKSIFTEMGVPFYDIDLAKYSEERRTMFELTGSRVVPQIFFNDKHIGGYHELKKLLVEGECWFIRVLRKWFDFSKKEIVRLFIIRINGGKSNYFRFLANYFHHTVYTYIVKHRPNLLGDFDALLKEVLENDPPPNTPNVPEELLNPELTSMPLPLKELSGCNCGDEECNIFDDGSDSDGENIMGL